MGAGQTVDLDTPISEMDFGVPFLRTVKIKKQMDTKIRNSLQRGGIMTLGQLLDHTYEDLELIDEGLGIVSREVIKSKLASMGLKLKNRKDL